MLKWWAGRDPQEHSADETDMPSTPGPIFAARAFKSALFGTPNPNGDTILPSQEHPPPQRSCSDEQDKMASALGIQDGSPSKRGILMTPGTVTRRKTVSFGVGVVDNEGKKISKSGLPNDFPGKFPSPWTPKVLDLADLSSGTKRETTLSRILEESREATKAKDSAAETRSDMVAPLEDDITGARRISPPGSDIDAMIANAAALRRAANKPEDDGDMTYDLNEPHSQSGRYWKAEYERYHEEAKEEMRKLVKYKQMAKSYAKKRDGEALDLSGKLREEQSKVALMEQKLSQLAGHVAKDCMFGRKGDREDLMEDLARQTALTVAYKDEVARFQLELQGKDDENEIVHEHNGTSSTAAQTLIEVSQELKKARDQLREMKSLRSEIHVLKLNGAAAEKKANRLYDENTKLAKELKRARDSLEKSDDRREAAEGYAGELEKKYDDMKQLAKSKRDEAEMLLKKSHDEKATLRKELRALKRQPGWTNLEEVSAKVEEPSHPPAKSAPEIGSTRLSSEVGPVGGRSWAQTQHIASQLDGHHDEENKPIAPPREPQKLTITRTISNVDKIDHDEKPRNSNTKSSRSKQSALSEVVNNAQTPKPSDIPSILPNRFSNIPNRPTHEPVLASAAGRWGHSGPARPSPGPSIFNIPSSPPRQSKPRSQPMGAGRSEESSMAVRPSPRKSTPRKTLPPERAAAAKARLEQRNTEKKRDQEL